MKKMNVIFYGVIAIIGFFLLAKTHINFKPFSIKFDSILFAIGWYCIAIGVVFIQIGSHKEGFKDGIELYQTKLIKILDNNKSIEKVK